MTNTKIHPLDHDGDGKLGGSLPGGGSVHDVVDKIDGVVDTVMKDLAALKKENEELQKEVATLKENLSKEQRKTKTLRTERDVAKRECAQMRGSARRVIGLRSVDELPTLDELNKA